MVCVGMIFLLCFNYRYILKDREEFFTGAQRSQIVWQILLRTPYDSNRPDKVGIVRLMNKQVYRACFPLHEGKHDVDGPQGEKSDRRVCISYLNNMRSMLK